MIRFFVIPPGSRSAFTPLGSLRRGKLLIRSRGYRAQIKRFERNIKRQKELQDLSRSRGGCFLSSLKWSEKPHDESFVGLLDKLDGGLDKPHEQRNMEW